ncbi:MAG: TIGR03560 family F420-dependent LLM class oxidoreductase [Candidatus Bathyarchaeia archaeon]|nr:TIGR03560 family F420-dependent LLM class oxidoreductase [Candidatus Bathyarchaeota archaeon]
MIKFGLQFSQTGKSYDEIRRLFLTSEELGYDSAWLMDHFYPTSSTDRESSFKEPVLECFTTLAALARETSSIRLGPLVACNSYRYPSLLAKMAATLDVISDGRMEFGLGAGWYKEEYLSYGIPFPKLSVRLSQMREALQIIKGMWTEEKTSFSGIHYKVSEAYNYPKPVQKPHPPIWIGGRNIEVLKVAAEHADYINIYFVTPREFRERVELLDGYLEALGRKCKVKYTWHGPFYIGRNDEEAKNIFRKRVKASMNPVMAKMSFEEYFERTVSGSAEDCLNKFQEFKDAGASYFVPSYRQGAQLLRVLYEDVVRPLKK